jgi:hypothetical protein
MIFFRYIDLTWNSLADLGNLVESCRTFQEARSSIDASALTLKDAKSSLAAIFSCLAGSGGLLSCGQRNCSGGRTKHPHS